MLNTNNQILHGDCEKILKGFSDKFCQLIVTSPVYADIENKYQNGYKGPTPEEYGNWMIPKVKEFSRIIKDSGAFVLNIDSRVKNGFESIYVYDLVCRIVRETDFKLWDTLFWSKLKGLPLQNRFWNKFVKQKNFKFNIDPFRTEYAKSSIYRMKSPIKKRFARTKENQEKCEFKEWQPNELGALPSNLLEISSENQRISDSHVACFPISLPEKFILGMTDQNDIVVDPFCGTGSTLLAAYKNNRKFIGIDIDSDYVKFSSERIGKYEKSRIANSI